MQVVLLAPDGPGSAATYGRQLIAALVARGLRATFVPLRGTYPATEPDPADHALLAALPRDALIVLDGIALALHQALPRAAAGLIHHPSALQGASDPAQRPALAAAERAALAALPCLIATSHTVAERLVADYAVPADRVHVLPPGVEDAPRTRPRDTRTCHLLTTGPLVRRRAHDVLLQALARLTDLDWRLTLIGATGREPDHEHALRALVADTGIDQRVTFAPPDTPPAWADTDIFVLAHPVPMSGGIIAQALRRGIPMAFAALHADPCPADAAAFCPRGDIDTLSKALRRMIFDPALRGRLADAAWLAGAGLPSWAEQAGRFAGMIEI